jgi:hypothetical protein
MTVAHLWVWRPNEEASNWAIAPLAETDEGTAVLTRDGEVQVKLRRGQREPGTGAFIKRLLVQGRETWTLMSRPKGAAVRVNGIPLLAGLRVLRDRDEILFEGANRIYFSSERLAIVEAFPGSGQPAFCPRCKLEITRGTPAVRCPNPDCRIWHHQAEEYPCWTYSEHCSLCNQLTALDSGYRWTPENL